MVYIYKQNIEPADYVREEIVFLLGPCQTGKTSLIRHTLKGAKVYDLLDTALFLEMSQNPGRLAEELTFDEVCCN